MKTCRRCQQSKSLNEMKKSSKKPDGRDSICKECYRKEHRKYDRTPHGRCRTAWYRINERAGNKRGDCPTYANVEVKMTKEEFFIWARPRYEEWEKLHPNVTPSINRIDPKGHYEISNIEMISWNENASGPKQGHLTTETALVDFVIHKCSEHLLNPEKVIKLLLNQIKTPLA